MKIKLYIVLGFSLILTRVSSQSLDLRMLKYFNSARAHHDTAFTRISNSLPIVAFSIPAGMITAGLIARNGSLETRGIETGVSLLATEIITYSLKAVIKRKRPYIAYPDQITGKATEASYSFPSGHTSIAFATATAVSLAYPRWYVITPAFTYAVLVAYSRSYLGVHYPGDVLAGAFVGTATSFLTFKLQRAVNFRVTFPIR